MRASDVDRERVAERLRQAASEGRLLTEELEQRLEASFSARTYGQLDAIVADLPGPRIMAPGRRRGLTWLPPALAVAIAVPVTLAVIAMVVFAVTGVLAVWMLWLAAGWWFFGRRSRRSGAVARRYGAGYGRSCRGWQRSRGRPRGFSA